MAGTFLASGRALSQMPMIMVRFLLPHQNFSSLYGRILTLIFLHLIISQKQKRIGCCNLMLLMQAWDALFISANTLSYVPLLVLLPSGSISIIISNMKSRRFSRVATNVQTRSEEHT